MRGQFTQSHQFISILAKKTPPDFCRNSITTLPDLKYWTLFIYLHDTSGYIQVTLPEQTPLFFTLISFNSCQQQMEFFRAWPAQTCTGFISIIKHTISIQAQIYNLAFCTEYLKMCTPLRCNLLFFPWQNHNFIVNKILPNGFFTGWGPWKSTQLFVPYYKLYEAQGIYLLLQAQDKAWRQQRQCTH